MVLRRFFSSTAFRRRAFCGGVYRREQLSGEAIREYLRPLRGSARQRRCFNSFLLAGDPRCTLAAVPGLREFDRPTLVLWAADDVYLSPSWGKRLFDEIPGACGFELIPFCGHFWREERPEEFAAPIAEFLAGHCASRQGEDRPSE